MRNSPTDNHTPNRPLGYFGKYRLEEEIGEGGTSIVYRAIDVDLDREVAIKMFKVPPLPEQAEFLEAFEACKAEAKTVAKFDHEYIIRILDAGVQNGIPFIVMPFASGGSLHKQYPLGTRLSLALVVNIVKQIAAGLQNAHDHGVVHCDVKPGNLFLGYDGRVLVGDFGIAKVQQKVNDQYGNLFMGTPEYMAPEQINGHPIPASDQYSLAAVVWQWLTGSYLFTAYLSRDVLLQQLYAQLPSLQQFNPLIPTEVETVLRKALAKDASARYATIQDFANALEAASHSQSFPSQTTEQEELPIQPLPSQRHQLPQRHRGLWLGVLLSMLALVLLSIVYLSFPLWPPVTVTINPRSKERVENYNFSPVLENSGTSANQIYQRPIEATTVQTQVEDATGPIVALKAQGTLTFYNDTLAAQTIPAGTIVTTLDGVQLITDTAVTVPAESLPDLGHASVSAHAVKPGAAGNIPAKYTPWHCCTNDHTIQVINTEAFTGGQDAQPGTIVQQSDLDRAVTDAKPALDGEIETLLNAEKHDNEVLAEQKFCPDTLVPSVPLGIKATTVSVQITRHCSAWVYDSATLLKLVKQQYRVDTRQKLGGNYSLTKEADVKVAKIDLPDARQGITSLHVQVSGVWSYQLSEKQKQFLLRMITGKSNVEARHLLISQDGIADATIQYNWPFSWLRRDTLPDRPEQIQLLVGSAVT